RAGSSQLGVSVVGEVGEAPGASGNYVSWMPYRVSTTIGSEMPVQVPIHKEQAEAIRQTLLGDKANFQDLGITVLYKADSTFALKPCTIKVEGNAEQTFKYFHEKISGGGGFWIFSFSYQRETIRQ